MRNIFESTNLEQIPEDYWDSEKSICYYPSSGYDFRHIFYWDYYCQKHNISFPEIFIHTDFTCLDYNPYPTEHFGSLKSFNDQSEIEGEVKSHPLLHTGYVLDVFGDRDALVIKGSTELYLEKRVFYPNRDLFYFSGQIKENTHKVFAIQCQLINFNRDVYCLAKGEFVTTLSGRTYTVINYGEKQNHNKILVADDEGKEWNLDYREFIFPTAKQIIIFLFTMENSNFFYDVLLENKIKVDCLTHINDGGASMGESKTKMDFIYLYSETIGLKNMIIDYTLEVKQQYISQWEQEYYNNPKVKRETIRRKQAELKIHEWGESKIYFPTSKGIYIKSKSETGNNDWDYNYFDNEPSEKFHQGKYKQYYHYSRK